MEWLTQNWLLLVAGIAAFLLMRRGGGCCGHHGPAEVRPHGYHDKKPPDDTDEDRMGQGKIGQKK